MKVLHVYSGNLYGGVESTLVVLARERARCAEMEPHFALCFDGRLASELRACGTPVHLLGDVRVRHPRSIWRARRALRALLADLKPDIVVCHSAWPYALFAGTARSAGLPVAFWLHDAVRGKHWTERWARLRTPDVVIYNSEFTGRAAASVFARARRELVHCPVAPPSGDADRSAIRRELGAAPETVVLVQVGRMERLKGHALLLHALGFLGDVPGWECWIVGGAQRALERLYESQLRTLATSRGIRKRVRFLGERNDVPVILRNADVLCQPNTQPEAFGVAIIEALYAGLPVVATDMGGPSEILAGGAGGVLVPKGNPRLYADALRTLIADASARRALGALGPERARALCDPTDRLAQLHRVLADVAQRGGAA
jgi:glycosyltransferase involved in cell wall biosynthesis